MKLIRSIFKVDNSYSAQFTSSFPSDRVNALKSIIFLSSFRVCISCRELGCPPRVQWWFWCEVQVCCRQRDACVTHTRLLLWKEPPESSSTAQHDKHTSKKQPPSRHTERERRKMSGEAAEQHRVCSNPAQLLCLCTISTLITINYFSAGYKYTLP